MKFLLALLTAGTAAAHAQAPAPPAFVHEKIPPPMLSLQEAIAAQDPTLGSRRRPSEMLPKRGAFPARSAPGAADSPNENLHLALRVVPPGSSVDYKLRIVVPKPDIDPRMIIDVGDNAADSSR